MAAASLLNIDKCTDDSSCTPPSFPPPHNTLHLLFSTLPFILTFSIISVVVLHRLFPALCGAGNRQKSTDGRLRKRIAAITFSTTLGATGVLAELILCEVSDWVDSDARRLAFRVVITMLLICLIVVIPFLEIHCLAEATAIARWDRRSKFIAVTFGLGTWLWLFWNLGDKLPIRTAQMTLWTSSRTVSEECLARVGVVGVSLMALLSGFGCISTPWQNFGTKPKPISNTDISRARAGFDATHDLLSAKRSQIRLLEKKIADKKSSNEGLMNKMMSTIRTDPDEQDYATLSSEVTGLETMGASLASRLASLSRRQTEQQRLKSPGGRIIAAIYFGFSVYCVYRITATCISHLPFINHHRLGSSGGGSFSQNDPINNILALLAKHWDPHLDRAAWSRQISFLMSGVIIAGSLSSVITTVNMITRTAPSVMQTVNKDSPNLALLVSQLSAVYVLASALLLRSNLPPQMSSVISESLGAPLDPAFVDHWFDGLFLCAAGMTAVVLGLGKYLGGWSNEVLWEEELDVECGFEGEKQL